MIAADILKRFEGMKSSDERKNAESHWQQIAEVIAPRKNDFLGKKTKGDKRNQRVYDSTGISANELLAAGLHGIATNPASRWFGIRVLGDDLMEIEAVKETLSKRETLMFREMHAPGASISTHLHEMYLDVGAFGTAVMFIGDKGGRPRFQTRHLREVYTDTDADGDVDTIYREFSLSARQIKQQWPDSVPTEVTKSIEAQRPDEQYEIVHGVFPREERKEGSALRADMPVASVYILRKGPHLLEDGGFEEFPYAVLMWSQNPGEKLGRGPGMTALPDVNMLQEMMRVHLRAGQKIVDPPLMVTNDRIIGPITLIPGGVNYLAPGGSITPLLTGGRLDISFQMMEDVRNRIGRIFFSDVVRPFAERTTETATEVIQRVQQQMRLLGPVLGRLEKALGQIITRVHGIMDRAGKFGELPDELVGQPFTVEFVSPIATAQRTGEVENMMNWLTMNAQFAQLHPEIDKRIKWDSLPVWTADRLRIDPELTFSDDEVEANDEESRQQDQLQQAAALAPAAKDAAAAAKLGAEAQQIGLQ